MSQDIKNYIIDEDNGIYLPKEEKEHLSVIAGDVVEVIRVPDGSLILRKSNESFRSNNIEQLREDTKTMQLVEDAERRDEEEADKQRQIIANKEFE